VSGNENDLENAMQEALEAVESRAQGEPKPPKADASEAVTEALLKAKKELEGVLEQTRKEAEHFRENWLRSAADFENYKKRAGRERDEVAKFANERILRDFLPVLDDLDRAIGALQSGPADKSAATLLEGVKMVQKKFLVQLEKNGVKSFECEGLAFDPGQQEAVQQIHSAQPAGQVVSQLQRGFTLQDRLLRPAMVVVSLGPATGGQSA